MTPNLILDKSALQSLRPDKIEELNRYFRMVVPPILLEEILGDLTKESKEGRDPKTHVVALARKISISSCYPIPDFHTLCIQDLMGNGIPMDGRKPIVFDRDVVIGDDGSFAVSHPEKSALYRWQQGNFSESDFRAAAKLRDEGHGTDMDALYAEVPKLLSSATTLEEFSAQIDGMLELPEGREGFLKLFLPMIGCGPQTTALIFDRWRKANMSPLGEFAPYATHCLRVHLLFLLGMGMNLVGKRRSNVLDIKYLCYLPFSHVFSSGDDLHRLLIPFFHAGDQSFVTRDDLFAALSDIALARTGNPDEVPSGDSLITKLWRRHSDLPPQPSLPVRPQSDKEIEKLREESRPLLNAMQK